MKIKNTLVMLMLTVSLVPLLFSSFLHFSNSAATVERDAGEKLRLAAYGAHKGIVEFLSAKKEISFASVYDRFLAQETRRLNGVASESLGAENKRLAAYLAERKSLDPTMMKSHVMDLSGRIVASTDESELGSFKHAKSPHFTLGLARPYIEDYHGGEEKELNIGGPLKGEEGETVGVLEYDYDLNSLGGLVSSDLSRLVGENWSSKGTGFTIANNEGEAVYSSQESIGVQKEIAAFASEKCRAGGAEANGTFFGSRGTAFFAAVECIRFEKDWYWAFSIYQNRETALAPVNALASTSLIIAAVTALVAGLIAAASTRRISAALESLTESINEVSRGNFGAEIPPYVKEYEDEIGELARAFDRTIVSLKIAMRQSAPKLKLEKEKAEAERLKTEQEKTESLEKFKRIFELSPEAIILVGKDRKIIDVNPRCLDWIGYERGEITGKSFLELPFLSTATKALMAAKFVQRMAGAKLAPYEIEMTSKKGGKIKTRLVGTAVTGTDGKPLFDLVMMSKIEPDNKKI